MKRVRVVVPVVLLFGASIFWFMTCGGGGGSSRLLSGDISLNVGSKGKNIELTAGDTWSQALSVQYNVTSLGGPFTSITMYLQDSLPGVDFTPLALAAGSAGNAVALAATPAQVWFYLGRQEDYGTVCDTGEAYGPFNIMINTSSQLTTVTPPNMAMTQTSMDIINIGAFSFCVQAISPVDAVVDLTSVDFNVEPCNEIPADISGSWIGTYSCYSDCGDIIDDTIELVITQDPDDPTRATYTDFYADYQGTVCGNRFSFKGGSAEDSESGTFIMDPGGTTATKTSTYRAYPPGTCSGECEDVLTRVD